MSLRRPFVAPRSTRTKRLESKSLSEKDVSSPITTGVGNEQDGYDQTPMSQWAVSDDEEDNVPITKLFGQTTNKREGTEKTTQNGARE